MPYVLIQHKVARYSDFEAVFKDDSAGGWETREAMEWATSGRAKSQVWVVENILQVEA